MIRLLLNANTVKYICLVLLIATLFCALSCDEGKCDGNPHKLLLHYEKYMQWYDSTGYHYQLIEEGYFCPYCPETWPSWM